MKNRAKEKKNKKLSVAKIYGRKMKQQKILFHVYKTLKYTIQ